MSSQLKNEQLYSMYDLSKKLPITRHPCTIYRWCRFGLQDMEGGKHTMESIIVGGIRHSSVEAWWRFVDRFNEIKEQQRLQIYHAATTN